MMKAKTAKFPVRLGLTVPLWEVADAVCSQMSPEEAFELIATMDRHYADWGFTDRLHKHFSKEMKKAPAAEREAA